MTDGSFMSSDWLGAFLIIAILFGGGSFLGGGKGVMPNVATTQDVNDAVNAQAMQSSMQNILMSSANNNYESARLINDQTMYLANQNNTNTLAAINGFNAVNQNMANGFAEVRQGIAALGAQMNECLKKIFYAIRNLFVDNTVDTYAW